MVLTEKLYVFFIGKKANKLIHAKSLCVTKANTKKKLESRIKKGKKTEFHSSVILTSFYFSHVSADLTMFW